MNVVVLGAGGFLGKHICWALTEAGHRVIRFPAGFDLVTARPERIAALVADTEAGAVVNAAGRAWKADEPQMYTGNVELPLRVISALALLDRRPVLVQLGSSHEYGPGTSGAGTDENAVPAPVTPYGRTKLLGARAVLDAARADGQPGVVLRIANVCGPGAPLGSLLGSVADRLARLVQEPGPAGAPAELRLPPLRAWRDFVDVRDVADAVLRTVRADDTVVTGQVINIGGGTAVHTRDLVNRLIAVSGLPVRVVEEDSAGGPSRVDTEWQQLDVSRAAEVLGWEPRHSLEQSLRDLLAAGSPPISTAGRKRR